MPDPAQGHQVTRPCPRGPNGAMSNQLLRTAAQGVQRAIRPLRSLRGMTSSGSSNSRTGGPSLIEPPIAGSDLTCLATRQLPSRHPSALSWGVRQAEGLRQRAARPVAHQARPITRTAPRHALPAQHLSMRASLDTLDGLIGTATGWAASNARRLGTGDSCSVFCDHVRRRTKVR